MTIFNNEENEIKKQKILNKMNILKSNQVSLMRELKNIRDEKYFTEDKLDKEIEETRKCWITTLEQINYKIPLDLAITLNFNNKNLIHPVNRETIQRQVNEWWRLYCSYHLGRKANKYKQMSYIGFIEHPYTNIHVHLAVHTAYNDAITDSYIYDEEEVITTLWKCVQNSGSVYVEAISDNKWFYYITKEFGFERRVVSSPNFF